MGIITKENFISRAIQVHGDKYDYSKTKYVNKRTKVIIECPHHGIFYQLPYNHIKGFGCRKCGNESAKSKNKNDLEYFISRAIQVHGDRYDYSKTKYVNLQSKVLVICKIHGEFYIRPDHHLYGSKGCRDCGYESSQYVNRQNKLTSEEFICRAIQVHGDRYDYSKTKYTTAKNKVIITCKNHGQFEQLPTDHIDGHGCNKCPKNIGLSKGHEEIHGMLESLGIYHEINNRTILYPQELDIFVPGYNLAIEFNGVYWHSSDKLSREYHKDKYLKCKQHGITLLQIWDAEWENKKELIASIIKSHLLIYEALDSSLCDVVEISSGSYNEFVKQNHIFGNCFNSKIKLGLEHDGDIVAVAGFHGNRLNRYCQLPNMEISNGLHKVSQYYKQISNIIGGIYTYIDNRFPIKNMDGKLLPPNLRCIKYKNTEFKVYDAGRTKLILNI